MSVFNDKLEWLFGWEKATNLMTVSSMVEKMVQVAQLARVEFYKFEIYVVQLYVLAFWMTGYVQKPEIIT